MEASSPPKSSNATARRASPISRLVYVQERREAAAAAAASQGDCASILPPHPASNAQKDNPVAEKRVPKPFPLAQIRLFPGGQVDEMESTHHPSKSSDESSSLLLPISSGITVVGMAKGEELCDIITPYHGVSALHFIIEVSADGTEHFIEDLESTNGTFIGTHPLAPYRMYQLTHGKEVTFGPCRGRYEIINGGLDHEELPRNEHPEHTIPGIPPAIANVNIGEKDMTMLRRVNSTDPNAATNRVVLNQVSAENVETADEGEDEEDDDQISYSAVLLTGHPSSPSSPQAIHQREMSASHLPSADMVTEDLSQDIASLRHPGASNKQAEHPMEDVDLDMDVNQPTSTKLVASLAPPKSMAQIADEPQHEEPEYYSDMNEDRLHSDFDLLAETAQLPSESEENLRAPSDMDDTVANPVPSITTTLGSTGNKVYINGNAQNVFETGCYVSETAEPPSTNDPNISFKPSINMGKQSIPSSRDDTVPSVVEAQHDQFAASSQISSQDDIFPTVKETILALQQQLSDPPSEAARLPVLSKGALSLNWNAKSHSVPLHEDEEHESSNSGGDAVSRRVVKMTSSSLSVGSKSIKKRSLLKSLEAKNKVAVDSSKTSTSFTVSSIPPKDDSDPERQDTTVDGETLAPVAKPKRRSKLTVAFPPAVKDAEREASSEPVPVVTKAKRGRKPVLKKTQVQPDVLDHQHSEENPFNPPKDAELLDHGDDDVVCKPSKKISKAVEATASPVSSRKIVAGKNAKENSFNTATVAVAEMDDLMASAPPPVNDGAKVVNTGNASLTAASGKSRTPATIKAKSISDPTPAEAEAPTEFVRRRSAAKVSNYYANPYEGVDFDAKVVKGSAVKKSTEATKPVSQKSDPIDQSSLAHSDSETENAQSLSEASNPERKGKRGKAGSKRTSDTQNADENTAPAVDDVVDGEPVTKKPVAKKKKAISSAEVSPSKASAGLDVKPVVMFTGIDVNDPKRQIPKQLGWKVVENWKECTHLVTDAIRRTVKFMGALTAGKKIVGIQWLDACKKASSHVEEGKYVLKDTDGERKYFFSLPLAMERSGSSFLEGYRFFLTPSVKPSLSDGLRDILVQAGGIVVTSVPAKASPGVGVDGLRLLIIGSPEDSKQVEAFVKRGFNVYTSEAILSSILAQEMADLSKHVLFAAS